MKKKLDNFHKFAESLYPREVDYLMSMQNFKKKENLAILTRIRDNCYSEGAPVEFDPKIDKRTYSYMKRWIARSLEQIDVDRFFDWLSAAEYNVMMDTVTPGDETKIVWHIKKIEPEHFYFMRFYELVQYYHEYIMVRNSRRNMDAVKGYLEEYYREYDRALKTKAVMLGITEEITKEEGCEEAAEIENLLRKTCADDTLDGYNRYLAVVRITIYYYNTRQFEKLAGFYMYLDDLLRTPIFYSKRILANYYANRAMMHSKLNQFEEAEKYGYLAIRNENSDYLFYLISLCSVLLREGKNRQAYKLMQGSIEKTKTTGNKYYKIGFAAYYIRTLVINEKYAKAVEYATNYFDAYRKDIWENRWHLFFISYMEALIMNEKYSRVLSLCHRYKLPGREKQHVSGKSYLPAILYYFLTAKYMERLISRNKFISSLVKAAEETSSDQFLANKTGDMLNQLQKIIPDEIAEVRKKLGLRKVF